MSIQIAHQTSSQEWTLPIQSLNHPDFLSCYIVQCVYIYIYTHTFCLEDLRIYAWKTDFCRSFSQQTFWSTWG
jgi:hypothetical protein